MRVVLIEDHALIRTGLRLLLEASQHDVLAEFDRAEEALSWLSKGERAASVELFILDLNLAGISGLEALPKLQECVKVLVLSAHEEAEYLAEAFPVGPAATCPSGR